MRIKKVQDYYGPAEYQQIGMYEIIALYEGAFALAFTTLKVALATIMLVKWQMTVRAFAKVMPKIGGDTRVVTDLGFKLSKSPVESNSPKGITLNILKALRRLLIYFTPSLVVILPAILFYYEAVTLSLIYGAVLWFAKNTFLPSSEELEDIRNIFSYMQRPNYRVFLRNTEAS